MGEVMMRNNKEGAAKMTKEKEKSLPRAAEAPLLDTEEVASSILVGPTIYRIPQSPVILDGSKDSADLTRGLPLFQSLTLIHDSSHNPTPIHAKTETSGVKKGWSLLYVAGRGGAQSKIDPDVYEWASLRRWRLTGGAGKFYVTSMGANPVRLHRLIMNPPADMVVDHINGDPLDNRRSNLRVCTQAENLRNRGLNRNHQTGFKGVVLASPGAAKPFVARIRLNGTMRHLGCFANPEDAAEAVRMARATA